MTETQQSLEKTGVRAKSNRQLLKLRHKQAKKVIMSISFSALLFYIIFISISLLNISPSILFKDTKFWFFISNVIVVIIVVDSGAFSSSNKGNHDLYEEFMMNSKTRNSPTTAGSSFIAKPITKTSLEKKPMPMILYDDHKGGHITAPYDKSTKPRYNRSNSEESITVVPNEDKRVLTRSRTKNYEDTFEEGDKYSAMSNEELNKRVEEFIERFNRGIRLQDNTV